MSIKISGVINDLSEACKSILDPILFEGNFLEINRTSSVVWLIFSCSSSASDMGAGSTGGGGGMMMTYCSLKFR